MNPIRRALQAVGGKQSELASRISVTPQALNQWVNGVRPVPAERCIAIEQATGGAVTRYELRPDVFGAGPDASNDELDDRHRPAAAAQGSTAAEADGTAVRSLKEAA